MSTDRIRLSTEFQSTLPQGERPNFLDSLRREVYFNPRSRKGSDAPCGSISAFAPDFNPRSRKGSDKLEGTCSRDCQKFQSTLPQGERLSYDGLGAGIIIHFNPRSRKGSDPGKTCHPHALRISIHAPARGATMLLRH